LGDRLEEKERV